MPPLPIRRLWCEQYLSTAAHNRVIYTNQKALLYGDYFIDTTPDENLLGTAIHLGSDQFKTWEDIIIFLRKVSREINPYVIIKTRIIK